MIVKTDDNRFVRDTRSNALLNIDKRALDRHRNERDLARRNSHMRSEMDELRSQVAILTELVQQLLAERQS
jgi:hypothetical protein